MNPLHIIFMGTPEFAVPSLKILVENNFDVVAVITAPDKPRGRGQRMVASAVKEYAVKHNLPLLQPSNLKSEQFLKELDNYKANLQIVVAFRMLPESVWAMPSLGTVNLHASLLPQYRGAAPINWAIINGEKETGVTTFFLRQEIDTGSIIFQEKEPVHKNDDAGSLGERLMKKGAELVLKTVRAIETGQFPSVPQTLSGEIKSAPKIFKETCEINWHKTNLQVRDFIRGLSPHPTAWTTFNEKTFKLFKATAVDYKKDGNPGEWATDNKTYLYVKTHEGWISVDELQPEGKKRMKVHEFLRGNKI